MPTKVKYENTELTAETILWDRDSLFIDFDSYWSRLVGTIAQKIAEGTTDNWNKFNLLRTLVIKVLGIDVETGHVHSSSPVNILPVTIFHSLLACSLKDFIVGKTPDELNNLFQDLVNKALLESQTYLRNSILQENIKFTNQVNRNTRQIFITNDSKENNTLFLKESKLDTVMYKTLYQINKEQLDDLLKDDSVFLMNNSYLDNYYKKKNINNILSIKNMNLLSFSEVDIKKILIHIDGASRGNPGPSGVGIVFYEDKKPIFEISEFIGNQTNNFAEYTALIRALEISLEKDYRHIEVKSDSELVVNQINKTYKVKDANIKELFDKVMNLVNKLSTFNISYVPREENLLADKLANKAYY